MRLCYFLGMSKMRKEDRPFSGTEVGTLIESFRNDFSIMAEKLDTVCQDVAILKIDVREIKVRLITVDDTIRIAIPDIYSRLTGLEAKAI